jgi:hypothetical protein
MRHKYLLKPTRADHPIRQRPFFHEIAAELAKLDIPLLSDLEAIEELLRKRKATPPLPPDPTPVPPEPQPTPPAPSPAPPTPDPTPEAPLDMLPLLQPSGDQGQQGSCFAFAGTHVQNLCEAIVAGAPSPKTYSEACLSWNTRALMGTTDQDSGGNLGDAIQAQEQTGTCVSALMPYDQNVFNVAPSADAVADEATHKAGFKAYPLDYSNPANIDAALASGYPIYFGFYVWNGFENASSDGTMPSPDGSNLGGHAQFFFETPVPASVGYDAWPDQNSWGISEWGLNGRCWFPKSAISTIMDGYVLVPHGG